MCELLGISVDRPVSAQISFRAFGRRDEVPADGWGLAWYPDRSVAVVKEPVKWSSSDYTSFLEGYTPLRAPLYLAHLRHRTEGGVPTHCDTHPFVRSWRARDYCFAHNGTLDDFRARLPLTWFQPVGTTDSEHYFCWLMDRLAESTTELAARNDWIRLHAWLRKGNGLGRLNCLLSDGERLFAYRDLNLWKGLSYSTSPLGSRGDGHLEDDNVEVEVKASRGSRGIVFATWPLNEKPWRTLNPGQLMIAQSGQVVFDSESMAT